MSLFNSFSGREPSAKPFHQLEETLAKTQRALSAERLAHSKTREERDELERQKADHQREFPDCGKAPVGMGLPTCPSCGVMYFPGPTPCQACGYAPEG